jgi:hypothetical protein
MRDDLMATASMTAAPAARRLMLAKGCGVAVLNH